MTGMGAVEWAVGILVMLVGMWGTWALGRRNLAEARAVKDPRTPYEAMAQRVMYLEERDRQKDAQIRTQGSDIARLSRRVDSMASTLHGPVADIIEWIDQGAEPPPPVAEIRQARAAIRDLYNDAENL